MPRKWQPREMQMVSEYLVKFYPAAPFRTRVRLGQLHPSLQPELLDSADAAFAGVGRRWADALVILKDQLILIEAAILADPGDISKLILYKSLLPHTPELSEYINYNIEMQLVYAIEDPLIVTLARASGIKPVFFQPDWIAEYIKTLMPSKQKASLTYPLPETKQGS